MRLCACLLLAICCGGWVPTSIIGGGTPAPPAGGDPVTFVASAADGCGGCAADTIAAFAAGATADAILCWTSVFPRATGTISGVTYDGNALTEGTDYNESDDDSQFTLWYWAPGSATLPDSGDVVATATASLGALGLGCYSFSDVNTTSPVDLPTVCTDSETDSDVVVTSSTDDLVVDYIWEAPAITVGAGQTQRFTATDIDGFGTDIYGSTEGGAASVTMSWTSTVGSSVHCAVNVNQE
jgi:hypothetical protein